MSRTDLDGRDLGPTDDPPVGGPPTGGSGGPPGRRRHAPGRAPRPSLFRAVSYAVTLALVVWALLVTPLPYVEYRPGSPSDIPPMIEITGADVTPIEGTTALLTVFLRDATPYSAVRVWMDPARELSPAATVAPTGLTPEFYESQRDSFADAFQVATAVGAEAAGFEVDVTTEVRVLDVLDGSPADGVLAPGDLLAAVDGRPLVDAAQLQARTRAADEGDELSLTVVHAGGERVVTVELATLGGTDQVGLGVLAETSTVGLELPFEIALSSTRIGGPSAGMMTAVTVFDLLSEEDLVAGRTVLGTGTVSIDGQVGPVGGVPEKVRSAAAHGADLVLVPQVQLEAAQLAAPDGFEVIGVATVQDAIDALRTD